MAVAALIASVAALPLQGPGPRAVARLRRGGDLTFPLYLFHYPLIVFLSAVLPMAQASAAQVACVVGGLLAVVIGLGVVAEANRPRWTRLFEALVPGAGARDARAEPQASA